MKLELEVPESTIIESAVKAWKLTFAAPTYHGDTGAPGWERIKGEVDKALLDVDVSDLVRKAIQQFTPIVVRDIVSEELKKLVRQAAKSELKNPSLLAPEKP